MKNWFVKTFMGDPYEETSTVVFGITLPLGVLFFGLLLWLFN